MKDSYQPVEGIIKHVDKKLTEEEIREELEKTYQRPNVRRFIKKNGFTLGTLKVDFKTPEELKKALREGISIGYSHYRVEPYIKPPTALQCFNCKRFGHTHKWCSRRSKCRYCAGEDHEEIKCMLKGDLEKYKCANCKGVHSATYHKCPEYTKHIRSRHQMRQSNDGQ